MDTEPENTTPKPGPPPPDFLKKTPPPPTPRFVEPVPPPVVKIAGTDELPEVEPGVPFNTRVMAAVVDIMVASGLAIAVIWLLPSMLQKLGYLTSLAYLLTRDSLPFLHGQSIGKKAFKIKAVTLDGQSLAGNWEPGIVRNITMVIPLVPLVELVVLLNREDKLDQGRRLGDEWAKTKVIPAPPTQPVE